MTKTKASKPLANLPVPGLKTRMFRSFLYNQTANAATKHGP
jgi:hypothetical protein